MQMGLALKFRKYEEIRVDLANKMQLFRLYGGRDEASWLQAYHQLTAALIMNDHDSLY